MEVKYKWLALHIFYSGDANKLLTEFVAPLIAKWQCFLLPGTPWFFIRYWEQGSHIRLRLNADTVYHDEILSEVEVLVVEHQDLPFTIEKVALVDYNPEISRYGNEVSMPWAEQHFAASSSFILNWFLLKKATDSIFMQAVKLHLLLLFSTKWSPIQLIGICDFFIAGWLPRLYNPKLPIEAEKTYWLNQFVQVFDKVKPPISLATKDFWQKLTENDLDQELKSYLQTNIQILEQYNAAGFGESKLCEIISSLMHMTNNRLGISNQDEAYTMYVVRACLHYIYKPSFNF